MASRSLSIASQTSSPSGAASALDLSTEINGLQARLDSLKTDAEIEVFEKRLRDMTKLSAFTGLDQKVKSKHLEVSTNLRIFKEWRKFDQAALDQHATNVGDSPASNLNYLENGSISIDKRRGKFLRLRCQLLAVTQNPNRSILNDTATKAYTAAITRLNILAPNFGSSPISLPASSSASSSALSASSAPATLSVSAPSGLPSASSSAAALNTRSASTEMAQASVPFVQPSASATSSAACASSTNSSSLSPAAFSQSEQTTNASAAQSSTLCAGVISDSAASLVAVSFSSKPALPSASAVSLAQPSTDGSLVTLSVSGSSAAATSMAASPALQASALSMRSVSVMPASSSAVVTRTGEIQIEGSTQGSSVISLAPPACASATVSSSASAFIPAEGPRRDRCQQFLDTALSVGDYAKNKFGTANCVTVATGIAAGVFFGWGVLAGAAGALTVIVIEKIGKYATQNRAPEPIDALDAIAAQTSAGTTGWENIMDDVEYYLGLDSNEFMKITKDEQHQKWVEYICALLNLDLETSIRIWSDSPTLLGINQTTLQDRQKAFLKQFSDAGLAEAMTSNDKQVLIAEFKRRFQLS